LKGRLVGSRFEHILSEGRVGSFTTRNRVKYAACSVSNFNAEDGHITEREVERMRVIAETGCGIITNQGAYPDPRGEGKAYFRQLAIYSDEFLPDFKRVADIIHKSGAIAVQQILHGGRYGGIDLDYCVQPSDTPQTLKHFRPPRAMSKEEIERCVEEHAAAAERAIRAGFDGVEITAFMGYLLADFLSPFTNRRDDEFGGSLENRARFMVELLKAIRGVIGDERLLIVRLNGEELMDEFGGNSLRDCMEFMKIAEDAGVDMISVVVGWHESRRGALGRDVPHDAWLYIAEEAKKSVDVPIAFGPRLADPHIAEKALADGIIDFWEVCRPMLADPELLRKIEEDRTDEIKPCIGGLVCLARMFRNLPYVCTVNPRLGHEGEDALKLKNAPYPKRVLVVGAGPAGLEAAIAAAKRGHKVTLCEKEDRIGGQINYAMKEPDSEKAFLDLLRYYETMLKKLKIELRLGMEVTPENCRDFSPDVVVIATGATLAGEVPVDEDAHPVDAFSVLDEKVKVGERVVVVGAERVGLVVAEHLASRLDKKVTIVERTKRPASDVAPTFKWRHAAWLREFSISLLTETEPLRVTKFGLLVRGGDGEERMLEADSVVLASPRRSVNSLLLDLRYRVDELFIVGDAVAPRSLPEAISEGYRIGAGV